MAVVSDAEARWVAALDELEASIERFANLALTAYGTTGPALVVPQPFILPEELAGRSDSVLTELHRVRERVGVQMSSTAKAPHAHAYHDDVEPSFLDERG